MLNVAVTGMAWATSLGNDVDLVWRRLLNGENGFVDGDPFPMVRNVRRAILRDAPQDPSDRLRQTCGKVLRDLILDTQLPENGAGLSLVLGTGFGSFVENEQHSLGMWVDDVAREFGGFDRAIALSTACCSGSDSIALGLELIRQEQADICICGGGDVVTIEKLRAHSALMTMSPSALRAFDRRHDGTLLGEGVACIILERLSRARARGVVPLAILRGAGLANDAAAMTSPDSNGQGLRIAIEQSLSDAGVDASDVGILNAHGSGTPVSDDAEQNAIKSVFHCHPDLLIFATKAALGHTLGATGAIEAIVTILALRDQVVPPILELEYPSEAFPCRLAISDSVKHDSRYGISVTMGFGGFCTSLVFERTSP